MNLLPQTFMLKLKPLNYDYAKSIDAFWKEYWSDYSLPDDSSKIIDAVVVNSTDKPIAYGQVKHFAELMLFTDMELGKRQRAEALKLLMFEAFRGADSAGLKEVYCLIKDMRFARLVAKHFGFSIIEDPGVLLLKKLE